MNKGGMEPRVLTILGATGTIGVNTLDVVARHPDRFVVFALTGATQVERMVEQCRTHRPRFAVMSEPAAAAALRVRIAEAKLPVTVLEGAVALTEVAIAPEVDTVMAAIVGAAGLPATLAAAQAGKRILLANKETLVVSGQLFMDAIAASGAELLPIDSEHNAIFQSLPRDFDGDFGKAGVKALWLTASGGPFRTLSAEAIAAATPAQAVAHPNWVMGRKISVDSASLMNKGLEVIEARWLFNARPEQIKVVVHPQSIVHSMVEYADGSVIAQMGNARHAHADRLRAGLSRAHRRGCVGAGTDGPAADLRGTRYDAFPLSATGVRRARRGWQRRGGAECCQRSRGCTFSR